MSARHDIEIGFDEAIGFYYAIWHPATAIGAGSSVSEALSDLREAVEFCAEYNVKRKLAEITKEV